MKRKDRSAHAEEQAPTRYCTKEHLDLISSVVRETETPSWFSSVPYNFGDKEAGTLKADEWRCFATLYLPLALIKAWGEGSTHGSDIETTSFRRALNHTMHLVSAIYLACSRTTSTQRATAYRDCIIAFLRDLPTTYASNRETHYTPNSHLAVHIYDFLLLFGPVHSWWTFPLNVSMECSSECLQIIRTVRT